MTGAAVVLRGDAAHLPLPDESVDLIVTSPPFWQLRSYTDGGVHYAGQVGAEPTPREYVDSLLSCTREWVRVLKPSGSLFIELGDKYAGGGQGGNVGGHLNGGPHLNRTPKQARGVPAGMQAKSLLNLPHRYAIRCADELGLILRAEIIWHHANGLPESVTDRVRRAHSVVFHFTRQPRYYAAVDEIREPHTSIGDPRWRRATTSVNPDRGDGGMAAWRDGKEPNPLGKLPGSVWSIPSQPLTVPVRLGVDHFAAFPCALVRPVILGWSPPGICVECNRGRMSYAFENTKRAFPDRSKDNSGVHRLREDGGEAGLRSPRQGDQAFPGIPAQGSADSCGDRRSNEVRRAVREVSHAQALGGGGKAASERLEAAALLLRGAVAGSRDVPETLLALEAARRSSREVRQDSGGLICTCPDSIPARPAVVVDPFAGTGTTMLVASAYGRIGIGVDRSMDYCRLARWRTTDPAERAKALQVPKPPPVPDGQGNLFDDLPA